MKIGKPYHGNGKTMYNRRKQRGLPPTKENPQGTPGESWVQLRDADIRAGKFEMAQPPKPKEEK